MTKTDGKPGRKFGAAEIERGLEELAALYKHDYESSVPDLLPFKLSRAA